MNETKALTSRRSASKEETEMKVEEIYDMVAKSEKKIVSIEAELKKISGIHEILQELRKKKFK